MSRDQFKFLKSICETFSISLWDVYRDGTVRAYSCNAFDSTLNTFHDFNRFLQVSEDDFNLWWELLREPKINFSDIVAIIDSRFVFDGKAYQFKILDGFDKGEKQIFTFAVFLDQPNEKISLGKAELQDDTVSLIKSFSRNRIFFKTFVRDIDELFETFSIFRRSSKFDEFNLSELSEKVHAIKGNSSVFGASQLEAECHDLEMNIIKLRKKEIELEVLDDSLEKLSLAYKAFKNTVSIVLNHDEILGESFSRFSYNEIIKFSVEMNDVEDRRKFLDTFIKKTIKECLAPYSSLVSNIAKRLNKEVLPIDFSYTTQFKVFPEYFFYLTKGIVHIFKNAIVHGIEESDERYRKGKPLQGKISVSFEEDKDFHILSISDDGRGINENIVRDVFNINFSTSEKHSLESGLGIGLYSLKKHLDSINGKVTVASSEGEGTIFQLYLPREDYVDLNIKRLCIDGTNIRKSHKINHGVDILVGHKEINSYIFKTLKISNVYKYRDVSSYLNKDEFYRLNRKPDLESFLHVIHKKDLISPVLDIELSFQKELKDHMEEVLGFLPSIKGMKRIEAKILMVIDELYTNAKRISSKEGCSYARLLISQRNELVFITVVDMVGLKSKKLVLDKVSDVYSKPFHDILSRGTSTQAGIGLYLLSLMANYFSYANRVGEFTAITVGINKNKREQPMLKDLYFFD